MHAFFFKHYVCKEDNDDTKSKDFTFVRPGSPGSVVYIDTNHVGLIPAVNTSPLSLSPHVPCPHSISVKAKIKNNLVSIKYQVSMV